MPRFERMTESRLVSRRAGVDKRIARIMWRIANDENVDLVGQSELRDKLIQDSLRLTSEIEAERQAAERKALRRELLGNIG